MTPPKTTARNALLTRSGYQTTIGPYAVTTMTSNLSAIAPNGATIRTCLI